MLLATIQITEHIFHVQYQEAFFFFDIKLFPTNIELAPNQKKI